MIKPKFIGWIMWRLGMAVKIIDEAEFKNMTLTLSDGRKMESVKGTISWDTGIYKPKKWFYNSK